MEKGHDYNGQGGKSKDMFGRRKGKAPDPSLVGGQRGPLRNFANASVPQGRTKKPKGGGALVCK